MTIGTAAPSGAGAGAVSGTILADAGRGWDDPANVPPTVAPELLQQLPPRQDVRVVPLPSQIGTLPAETIRPEIVDRAYDAASMGGFGPGLANALANPAFALTAAERAAVIDRVVERNPSLIYGGELGTAAGGPAEAAQMDADRAVVAGAIQDAVARGLVNGEDLARIADMHGGANGAQRLAYTLSRSPHAMQANGAAEQLADVLWSRPNASNNDRAAAAILYSSSVALTQRNLSNPADRVAAFEAMVTFNERAPYAEVPAGYRTMGESHRQDALRAQAQLFTGNPDVLISHYTNSSVGIPARGEMLARFFSQTVFNPDASGLRLSGNRDMQAAVRTSVDRVGEDFLAAAASAATTGDRMRPMENYGQVAAALTTGASLAIQRWDSRMAENEATRDRMAGLVSAVVADFVGARSNIGDTAGFVAGELTTRLLEAFAQNPARPDQAAGGILFDTIETGVDRFRTGRPDGDAMMSSFRSAYATEAQQIQQNLNLNPGGYR